MNVSDLREILQYVPRFRERTFVVAVDGEVGEKKLYDPRSWGREAESAMAARVVEACKQLGSAGKALK